MEAGTLTVQRAQRGPWGDRLWHPLAVVLLVLAHGAGVHAQVPAAADPMASPACKSARESLEAAYRAATDRRDETALKLQAARRNAALVCLGRGGAAAGRDTPNRVPPALAVPPARQPGPPPVTPRATPATPPSGPVAIPRPTLITSCDDAGCWGNDGQRYNRAGSQLVGPRGTCSVQGGVLNCP